MDNAEYERIVAAGDPDTRWIKWVGILLALAGLGVAVYAFFR